MSQPVQISHVGPPGSGTPVGTAVPVTIAGGTATVGVVSIAGNRGTEGSGTLTASGAQYLFSTATPANGFSVGNPNATADLWVSEGTATATSAAAGMQRIPPNGGLYETPPGMKPVGAITVFGTASGLAFNAKQW